MALEIDEAGVRFVIQNLQQYLAGLEEANAATVGVGASAEATATRSVGSWGAIGRSAGGAALAVGAAAVVIGGVMLKLAGDLDSAYDTIRVGTGATGVELDSLKGSFENVFSTVPADAAEVADALTKITIKTGLTGPPLEELTRQFVELSRITKTDVTANIDGATEAFNRWGIPVDEAGTKLDFLFRVGQKTGASVADLTTDVTQAYPELHQLGLDFDHSAVLMGQFRKAGIDTGTMVGALRIALRKMATEGVKDPQVALNTYIQQIKDAGSAAEANSIGVGIFGRSAIGMVDAIRSGKLDIEGFTRDIQTSGETIIGATEATDDWPEKLEILRNKLLIEVSPALNALFSGVTNVADAFGDLPTPVQNTILILGGVVVAATGAQIAMGLLSKVIGEELVNSIGKATGAGGIPGLIGKLGLLAGAAYVGYQAGYQLAGLWADDGPARDATEAAAQYRAELAAHPQTLDALRTRYDEVNAQLKSLTESSGGYEHASDSLRNQIDQLGAEHIVLEEAIDNTRQTTEAGTSAVDAATAAYGPLEPLVVKTGEALGGFELAAKSAADEAKRHLNPTLDDIKTYLDRLKAAADETKTKLLAMLDEPAKDTAHRDYQLAVAKDALAVFDLKHAGEDLTEAQQAQRDELQKVIDKFNLTTAAIEAHKAMIEANWREADLLTQSQKDLGDAAASAGFRVHNEAIPPLVDLGDQLQRGTDKATILRDNLEERWPSLYIPVDSSALDAALKKIQDIFYQMTHAFGGKALNPFVVTLPIEFQPAPREVDPNWLLDWFNKKDEAERLREQMRQAYEEWLKTHPLEITVPVAMHPAFQRPNFVPDVTMPELRPSDRTPFQKAPGPQTSKIDAITDPAQFLQLVMQAIATIEALAGSDVPTVSRKKLIGLATALRHLIVEFGNAMKGVSLEASAQAAAIAGFLDPILKVVNEGVDALDKLGDAQGVGLPRIRVILDAIANVARVAIADLGALDVAKLDKTQKTAALVAQIVQDIASAASALRTLTPPTGTVPVGTVPGTIPGAAPPGGTDWAQILAGIVAGLPRAGSVLQGAPGGISYSVNATYLNPQQPSSIRLDLIELGMLASA